MRLTGVGGQARDVSVALVKTFSIAGADIRNVQFLVQENDFGPGTVGVLGQNLLGFRDVEFDLANGEIRLFQTTDCRDAYLAYWDKTHAGSVVDVLRSDRPGLPQDLTESAVTYVYVNGVKIRAVWDTGAALSTISLSAAKRAGVDLNDPQVRAVGATKGFGDRLARTWIAPFASFKVGDEEIKNTKLRVSDFNLRNADMLLGADFFLSHRVFVANRLNRLFFTYNGGPVFRLEAAANPSPPASASTAEDPHDADGYYRRGAAFAGRQDFVHALEDLDKAVALEPNEARYVLERGRVRFANKQPVLGLNDVEKAIALKPDDVEARVIRAQVKAAARDPVAAQVDVDAAAEHAAKEANVRLALGNLYERLNLYQKAIEQYDLWLQFHDEDVMRWQALNARCYAKGLLNQDLDHALRDCNAAVRLMPNNPQILDSRGLVQLRRGEFDRAIADYDAALKIQPRLALALYGRGLAKAKKGQAAEGQADIAAAVAVQANIVEIAKSRGLAP